MGRRAARFKGFRRFKRFKGLWIAAFSGYAYEVSVTGLPSRQRVILSDSEESWYVESLR